MLLIAHLKSAEVSLSELDPSTRQLEVEYRKKTLIKNINKVQFGSYLMDTWYYSPYPGEVAQCEKIYVCSYCFKYMRSKSTFKRHFFDQNCIRHNMLPGRVIYWDESRSLYVCCVDGQQDKLYCQNLNLFCKFFIDHKTVYFDIERFLFYLLFVGTKDEQQGSTDQENIHLAGYFSKVILESANK